MALNKVEICGVNTARLPILTNEEKDALFIQIRQGDAEAREQFIKGNLRLVLSVIRRFSSAGENVDDLFQIGCIGLIKAIDHFNTELGVRFSTYAVPMIIGEIRRFLRDNNSIRVSRSLRDTAYKAIYAREMLLKKNQKEPSITEVASEVGIAHPGGCPPLGAGAYFGGHQPWHGGSRHLPGGYCLCPRRHPESHESV